MEEGVTAPPPVTALPKTGVSASLTNERAPTPAVAAAGTLIQDVEPAEALVNLMPAPSRAIDGKASVVPLVGVCRSRCQKCYSGT